MKRLDKMPPKKKFRSGRSKKRRFAGNRYTIKQKKEENEASVERESSEETEESDAEETTRPLSAEAIEMKSFPASVRKLDEPSGESNSSSSKDDSNGPEGFRFVDISVLASVFQLFRCPVCKYGHIELEEDGSAKMGFASLLVLKCKNRNCKFSERFYTSSKIGGSQAFEVNRRIVLATRNIGIGHQALTKFTGVMNMPSPMNENSYRDHVAAVKNAAETVCKKSMGNAVEEVKSFYEPEQDGIFDIGVSGDGTWRKRGYSSSYGIVTALSTITGKVLDVEVMSKDCKECTVWRNKEGSQEFHDWWEGHQHLCEANYLGSSASMDASGLLAIFQRSVDNYSVRYTEFLGDGDSKAHRLIVEEGVYGNKEVTKLECVGHVQKRLGSRLRSLKTRLGQTRLDDGKSIGGTGRLTKKTIDKLQVYYGNAIRNNTHDIREMQNAVLAIWHHSQSTDDSPDHDLCPPGEDSWCGYQRDLAMGTSDYEHNHALPRAVADTIFPIFEDLSDEDLLKRCLHGGTQNQNEAINALIWQRATKETHSGLNTVEVAVFLAVSSFNDGAGSISLVLEELGISPGVHCENACSKLDHDRLRHARRKSSEHSQKRRRQIRNWKKGYTDTLEALEGPHYAAGAF